MDPSLDAKKREAEDFLTQGATTLLMGIEGAGTPNLRDAAAKLGKDCIGVNVVPFAGYGAGHVPGRQRFFDQPFQRAAKLRQDRGSDRTDQGSGETRRRLSHPQRDEASYGIGLMGSTA